MGGVGGVGGVEWWVEVGVEGGGGVGWWWWWVIVGLGTSRRARLPRDLVVVVMQSVRTRKPGLTFTKGQLVLVVHVGNLRCHKSVCL